MAAWSAPAFGEASLDDLEKALAVAGPELKLPPDGQEFFEPRLLLGPDGKLVGLDLADPTLAPLEAQWTAALKRHEPYPRPAGSPASRPLSVRTVRHRLVPGSLQVAALDEASAPDRAQAEAVLWLALDALSECADPPAAGARRSPLRVGEASVRFDASGAPLATAGLPAEAPFAACLDARLRATRLEGSGVARAYKLGFEVESGPARVSLTVAQASERLPDLKRVLRDEEGAFRVCFDDGLRRDPSLTGRMRTRLVVDGSGAVLAAQVAGSTVGDEKVQACVLAEIRKLRFPAHPSKRPLSVVHPILFRLESLAGGPQAEDGGWLTASSEHFVLYTEGGRAVAQRALEEAERAYQGLRLALAVNLGTVVEDARPMTLVVISRPELYTQVAPLSTGGQFRVGAGFGDDDLLLLRGVGNFETLRHEITHRLVSKVVPRMPTWLSEGLAQYYQWTEIDLDSITVGSTARTRAAQRVRHRSQPSMPLPSLLSASRADFGGLNMAPLYHAAFWFTSALESNPRDRLRLNRLLQALHRGQAPSTALQSTFSKPDLARLANDYPLQMTSAEAVSYRRAWTPPALPAFTVKRLDGADGRVLVARLYGRAKAAQARRQLEDALSLAPDRAEAFARRALLVPATAEERREDAERAVQLDPAGRFGWEALGVALLADPRGHRVRLGEAASRLEGFTESAEAQCLAAIVRDALGDARALAAARRAVRLAPAYPYGQAVLARLAEKAGQTAEARKALAEALALATTIDPRSPELLRPDRAVTLAGGN